MTRGFLKRSDEPRSTDAIEKYTENPTAGATLRRSTPRGQKLLSSVDSPLWKLGGLVRSQASIAFAVFDRAFFSALNPTCAICGQN